MVDHQQQDMEEEHEKGMEVEERAQGMEVEEQQQGMEVEDQEQGMEEGEQQDSDEENSDEQDEQYYADEEDGDEDQVQGEEGDQVEGDQDTEEQQPQEEEEEQDEAPDQRVLSLLMPMFCDSHDEFGKETVPPLPLLLDQVSEGQLPRSKAPLLRLPLGVLGEIVQHLEWSALDSFSLVNKDCWQLARSRRFASVLLDCSDSCFLLLSKLEDEGGERLRSPQGTTSQPSIGACIRRITVATNAVWVSERHGINLGQESDSNNARSKRRIRKRMASASRFFFDCYLPHLLAILSRREILPHLELVDWEDKILLPPMFFKNLACSAVKHLKLFRVMVDDECTANLPEKWPLETLHLEVNRNLFGKGTKKGSTAFVCANVLRQCAPTLVSLTWEDGMDGGMHSFITDSQDPVLFPCLRELRLGHITFADSASLDALLGGNLVSLSADTDQSAIHKQCFQNRGTIRSLETFVWDAFRIQADHALEFLGANPQLSMLSIPNAAPPVLLGIKLLSLLSSSFKNLRSLSLVWEGVAIPDSALGIIGTLKTLEQIHLSAGHQTGWRHDWLIDHKAMRTCLGSLPLLQKIAFSRDSYDNGVDASDISRYYVDKEFHESRVVLQDGEDLDDDESREAIWERIHRQSMLCEAAQYVEALPKLEWLYLGQIPMSVRSLQVPGGECLRDPVPLWAERDKCWTLLRKMFAGSVD